MLQLLLPILFALLAAERYSEQQKHDSIFHGLNEEKLKETKDERGQFSKKEKVATNKQGSKKNMKADTVPMLNILEKIKCEGCNNRFPIKKLMRHVSHAPICRKTYGEERWNEILKQRKKSMKDKCYIRNKQKQQKRAQLYYQKNKESIIEKKAMKYHGAKVAKAATYVKGRYENLIKVIKLFEAIPETEYNETIDKHNSVLEGRPKNHKCEHCAKCFADTHTLKIHTKSIHERRKDCKKYQVKYVEFIEMRKKNGCKQNFKCDLCDRVLKSFAGLKYHNVVAHIGEKPFKCTICENKYMTKPQLQQQKKTVHGGEKHECVLCKNVFSSIPSVKNHIKSIHMGTTKIPCDRCGKGFKNNACLKRHVDSVHDNLKNFKCHHCGKSFTQSHAVKTHIKTVHEGRKDYKCKNCEQVFAHSTSLNEHIKRAHSEGEKRSCPLCTKSFVRSSDLKRHIRSVHEGQKVQCEQCNKSFSDTTNLRRHIVNVHSGNTEKPSNETRFSCDNCEKTYSRSQDLKKHNKNHHGFFHDHSRGI